MTVRKLAHIALAALLVASCGARDKAVNGDDDSQARGGFSGSAFTMHESLEVKQGLPPAAVPAAGTVNGAAIDKEDFAVALVTYTINDTTGGTSIVVTVEESDTSGGTYTAVTGAAFTAFTNARDNGVYYGTLQLRGRKQFLRLVEVTTGTFTTSFRSASIIFGGPATQPVGWTITTPDFHVR